MVNAVKCSQRAQIEVVLFTLSVRYLLILDRPIDSDDDFLQFGDL